MRYPTAVRAKAEAGTLARPDVVNILQVPTRKEADGRPESSPVPSLSTQWWRTYGVRARQAAQTWLWKKGVLGISVPYPQRTPQVMWRGNCHTTSKPCQLHIKNRPSEIFLSETFLYSVQTWKGGVAAAGGAGKGFYTFLYLCNQREEKFLWLFLRSFCSCCCDANLICLGSDMSELWHDALCRLLPSRDSTKASGPEDGESGCSWRSNLLGACLAFSWWQWWWCWVAANLLGKGRSQHPLLPYCKAPDSG